MLIGKKNFGLKIDIWSYGIILFMLVTGNSPFNDNNEMSLFKQIINGKFFIPSFFSKKCSDIIICLVFCQIKLRKTVCFPICSVEDIYLNRNSPFVMVRIGPKSPLEIL